MKLSIAGLSTTHGSPLDDLTSEDTLHTVKSLQIIYNVMTALCKTRLVESAPSNYLGDAFL